LCCLTLIPITVEMIILPLFLDSLYSSEWFMSTTTWQVPITVHYDHGSSKSELMEAIELVSNGINADALLNFYNN
jgi:hypothetical protein